MKKEIKIRRKKYNNNNHKVAYALNESAGNNNNDCMNFLNSGLTVPSVRQVNFLPNSFN